MIKKSRRVTLTSMTMAAKMMMVQAVSVVVGVVNA
jgi:hypothetical protein